MTAAPKFDLRERLGAGHFGEVWLAVDLGLGVQRAVKLIPPDRIPDQSNFFREAQILKAAEHPNIVRVEETGLLEDGRLYVAMEYLQKRSLEDEARGAYVPLSRAKRIMVDVLRGLHYAHIQGIIHRDIKPANILIGDSGDGKLSDFGLAIVAGQGVPRPLREYAYVAHLAPELLRTPKYSVLSDVYACGVTLYRLVNGDSYLPALGTADMEKRILSGTFPDRNAYREFVPRPVRTVINRALSLVAGQRFATADEMRHAVERLELHMNWHEQRTPDSMSWIGNWDGRCYEIERGVSASGRWYVTARKGKSKAKLRRMSGQCIANASRNRAEALARKLLQGIVLGKIR